MALDWSKEISLAGLRKRKPKVSRDAYPSKTYMNMVLPDPRQKSVRTVALTVLPLLLALVALAKFGVFDFYARVIDKSATLSERSAELQALQSRLTDYDSVLEEYRTYESVRMTTTASDVAAVDALDLVDSYVAPVASIEALTFDADTLTLTLSSISLDQVGGLVSLLYQQPIVGGVQVSTATTGRNGTQEADPKDATVTMIISLRSESAAEAADDAS